MITQTNHSQVYNGTTESLMRVFANASTKPVKKPEDYETGSDFEYYQDEIQMNGVKNFKRKVMGFCPTQTTKTLEDLAKLFVDMKLTSTIEDASKIIPLFQGKKLYYTTDMFDTPKKYLEFEKTKDEQGKEAYVITANTASCDYYL